MALEESKRDLNNRLQGASTGTILKVTEKMMGLLAEVITIIEDFKTQLDPNLNRQNNHLSVALSKDPAQSQPDEAKAKTASDLDAPTKIPNFHELPESVRQELVEKLNAKLERFEQESMNLLLQSSVDSAGDQGKKNEISRDAALQMLIGLVGQLQNMVRNIPDVNVKFFDNLSQLLREPGTIRDNRSERERKGEKGKKGKNRILPPPPNEIDGPQTFFSKAIARVKGIFGKKEKSEPVQEIGERIRT